MSDSLEKFLKPYGFVKTGNHFEKIIGADLHSRMSVSAIIKEDDGINLHIVIKRNGGQTDVSDYVYVTHTNFSRGDHEENTLKLKKAMEGLMILTKF